MVKGNSLSTIMCLVLQVGELSRAT